MDAIFELKQRMMLLEKAHASAGMGHFILDAKRMTIEFSSWVRENIGLNDMPIPLDRLEEIVAPDDREEFGRQVAELIERKQDFSFETNVITAKGKTRTQRVSGITAFENSHKREGLIGFFGILEEITNEKASQQALREAHDSVRSQLAARNNLLAVVSHEIRTPLGGILGIIDQMKHERSAAERERALTLIEDSCEVLLDTLDAIVQQARIGDDEENLEAKRFRPGSVAQRVAELFRPLARRKGLVVEVQSPPETEAVGDPARLQQVLANFVSNGVKFTQTGAVTIHVREPSDSEQMWEFVVADTGSGMDQNRLSNIFEPFGESSADTLGRAVGAGLGLSITRDLVDSMGGKIDVSSELGRGSVFTLRIPLDEVSQPATGDVSECIKGRACFAIEKATDLVLVEAIASQQGFELCELESDSPVEHDSDGPLVAIVDRVKLADVAHSVLSSASLVVVLTSDGKGQIDTSKFDEEFKAKVVEVSNLQIARALPEVLKGASNDAP